MLERDVVPEILTDQTSAHDPLDGYVPNGMTFEEALAALEATISAIEQGKIGLEQAISEYEKGMKLIQRCRTILASAEAKIQQLQLAEDGTLEPKAMESSPSE